MPDSDDFSEWCRRLAASDRAAYAEVFDALYEPLFRYACSLTADEAAARDITQDAFVRLWDVRDDLDPNQSLKSYLYRITRNRAYNHRRDRKTAQEKADDVRHHSNARPAAPPAPDEAVEGEHLEASMREWISALPARQREAIVLSRFEGLSHEQIAEVMDISPRTVNNHIVRGLKRLRDRVHDYKPALLSRDE